MYRSMPCTLKGIGVITRNVPCRFCSLHLGPGGCRFLWGVEGVTYQLLRVHIFNLLENVTFQSGWTIYPFSAMGEFLQGHTLGDTRHCHALSVPPGSDVVQVVSPRPPVAWSTFRQLMGA